MPSEPEKLRKRRTWLLLGVSLALVGAFWWLLRKGGLPLLPSREAIARVGVYGVLGYSALWLLTLFLKAFRWRYQLELLAPVALGRVLSASAIGFAAQVMLPLKTGEFVRPLIITRGTSVSFLAAMSTSATERIVDSFIASAILIVSLLNAEVLSPLPDRIGDLPVPAQIVPTLGYVAAAASLVAICVIGCFYAFRDGARRMLARTVGHFSPGLSSTLESKLSELAQGFSIIASQRSAIRYLSTSIAYWALYVAAMLFLLRASGFEDATLAHAGVLTGTLAFSFVVPNAPGFFGVFQVSIYGALAVFYAPEVVQDLGATAVFWLYVLQIGWVLTLAPIGAWFERVQLRSQ